MITKLYTKAQMREAFQTGILTEAVDADYDDIFEEFIAEMEPLEAEIDFGSLAREEYNRLDQ